MQWLDETNYLVENYLDDDLNDYDNESFEVKLIGKESFFFKKQLCQKCLDFSNCKAS